MLAQMALSRENGAERPRIELNIVAMAFFIIPLGNFRGRGSTR